MIEINRIHLMDALEGLKKLENDSVDLIVTDPPYNIASANALTIQRGSLKSTEAAWGDWDMFHPFDYKILICRVLIESYRVLKPGGSLYMFTAQEDNGYFIHKARERGFQLRRVLAMVRKNPLPSFSKRNWRSGFELCMYLTKPSKGKNSGYKDVTFNFLSQQDCINVFVYTNGKKHTKHPTEKPQDFIELLVMISSNPGDLVVDPFMGGGTTAAASRKHGRRFIGFELNKDYIKMGNKRLSDLED
ncbi:Modification methylase MboII [Limihaloglobus sulfuriphilus]|uniref:Methyltransferase n=1 Tax=Limihaloglobus sulfuriphilus TaxID=1851148 RepID=A0A1Q2MFG4_9BACT|nr:site-specific DNA-methyltransferase [Limihaloglobus sulfuriphilus]AQQ71410.1 Modification methylase MboII [Limihaloglobus sulfuriphilus]